MLKEKEVFLVVFYRVIKTTCACSCREFQSLWNKDKDREKREMERQKERIRGQRRWRIKNAIVEQQKAKRAK